MFEPRQYVLKDGRIITVRSAEVNDAAAALAYIRQVGGESDNLTFGAEELRITIMDKEYYLYTAAHTPNQLCLLAESEGRLCGMLNFRGGTRPRIHHQGDFGLTVLRQFWGLGVGKALLESLLSWARASGLIRKVNLTVRADNERAIALYTHMGFKVEGCVTRYFSIDGAFFDALFMGIAIDPWTH